MSAKPPKTGKESFTVFDDSQLEETKETCSVEIQTSLSVQEKPSNTFISLNPTNRIDIADLEMDFYKKAAEMCKQRLKEERQTQQEILDRLAVIREQNQKLQDEYSELFERLACKLDESEPGAV